MVTRNEGETQRKWRICECDRCLEDTANPIWVTDDYGYSLAISYDHVRKGDNCDIGRFFKEYAKHRNPVLYRYLEMLGRL